MFLLNLSNNESSVDLTEFLKFVAATDRIPIPGFVKPIEILLLIQIGTQQLPHEALYDCFTRLICRETFEKSERWRGVWK